MIRIIDLSTGIETSRELTQDEININLNTPKPDSKDAIRAQIKALRDQL